MEMTIARAMAARLGPMKAKKKKIALPRRQWKINPVTRIKESARKYSRPRLKRDEAKYGE
jgi:hypothetical protein